MDGHLAWFVGACGLTEEEIMQPSSSYIVPHCNPFRLLGRKFASVMPGMLLLFLVGCDNETTGPTPTDASPKMAAAAAATSALVFHQVSGGYDHTCGVTSDNRAFCWGRNNEGQLGDGTLTNRTRPTLVAGGLAFLQVSAGLENSCGITTTFQAFCWGKGSENGDGSTTRRTAPSAVAGGHLFRQLDVGAVHTCAVRQGDSQAYCWGHRANGALGDGTDSNNSSGPALSPVPVSGNHAFRQVAAGSSHSCGVTTSDEAYCWGFDGGRLGNDSEDNRSNVPVRVAGTQRWAQIDAGTSNTCATTASERTFCWGQGDFGAIGDKSTLDRYTPRTVHGLFTRVSVGDKYACGETSTNLVSCWGDNDWGQFGNGSTDGSLSPIPAAEGRHFSQISVGRFHTCGRTAEGEAYCWGNSSHGRVGDGIGGSGTMQTTPVRVVDP